MTYFFNRNKWNAVAALAFLGCMVAIALLAVGMIDSWGEILKAMYRGF